MTSPSIVWTRGLWVPYCTGSEPANPSPPGIVPEMATARVRARPAARATLVGCLQGQPPDASEDVWLQASGTKYNPVGPSQPALRAAECHLTSGWPGGTLLYTQCQSVVSAGCRLIVEPDLVPVDCNRPGSERRQALLEPCWFPALMYHQVPRVLGLVLQGMHRPVWVVWHCRSYQPDGAAG